MLDENLATYCVNYALDIGADYCDVRVYRLTKLDITQRFQASGSETEINEESSESIGLRVLVQGCWGFSGTKTPINKETCRILGKEAVKSAKSQKPRKKIELAPVPILRKRYEQKPKKNPAKVNPEEVQEFFAPTVNNFLSANKHVISCISSYTGFIQERLVITSEGSNCFEKTCGCGIQIKASAKVDGMMFSRTWPETLNFSITMQGLEALKDYELDDGLHRIGSELKQLQNATSCPNQKLDLILAEDMLALQVHETIGHPCELDRALGLEWDFAGSTLLTPENLNGFKLGSDIVNIVADPTIEHGPGSYTFDDEAVEGRKIYIVKQGVFVGYLSSRQLSAELKTENVCGSMRSMNASHIPLIRMNNINLLPGDWTRDEIISDTKEGMMITQPSMEIFDQRRRTFIFSGEIGFYVRNGEVVSAVKNPVYHGQSVDFWRNCDAIAKDGWRGYASGCGKGRPHQRVLVGHFCSAARFNGVKAGVES
ncbi:MAG: TldD/PmbA family protein [Candidatus Bathyarchaeia archaeon]